MAITDTEVIKNIVRTNFNKSSELYEKFESKYGLFEYLTEDLARVCNVGSGMAVCDIGCGSGTSSLVLGNIVGDSGKVLGIDFSEEMLAIARKKVEKNIEFILGDANSIGQTVDYKFDQVLFNACIFLIPEPETTLKCASEILKNRGIIGMNYLMGLYPDAYTETYEGPELFEHARIKEQGFAPYGRGIMDVTSLGSILNDIGFKDVTEGIISKKMSFEEVRAFYSIPAQSAALWPKNNYNERLELLEKLLQFYTENNITEFHQYWGWCKGEKNGDH